MENIKLPQMETIREAFDKFRPGSKLVIHNKSGFDLDTETKQTYGDKGELIIEITIKGKKE